MEDTLRYFYSALFQGIATIITLGSMFYLYFLLSINFRKREIVLNLMSLHEIENRRVLRNLLGEGVVNYVRAELVRGIMGEGTDAAEALIDEYDSLNNKSKEIKTRTRPILVRSMIILILSLGSLISVGHYNLLNQFLFIFAVILVLFTIIYFKSILNLAFIILDLDRP